MIIKSATTGIKSSLLSYKMPSSAGGKRICEDAFSYLLGYSYSLYPSDIPSQYSKLKREHFCINKTEESGEVLQDFPRPKFKKYASKTGLIT